MQIRTSSRRRAGFTLAEMMVVIVIIGLLATLVVPNVLQRMGKAYESKAKVDITAIAQALDEYAMNNAMQFPDSLEVLVQPDVNGYTYLKQKTLPKDPWNREYMYEPPQPGQPEPRIYTLGKDGAQGGEGDERDIDNFTIKDGEGNN